MREYLQWLATNWPVVVAIAATCGLWCLVGRLWCEVTHKQRGIEVDRPLTDILPGPPPPIIVPDTPAELFKEEPSEL